ncbi:MAG: hypothetical protein HYS12_16915 [Planctomycetes bacterium]|nr:hypothetical protein [Planctomycetota bacterium]
MTITKTLGVALLCGAALCCPSVRADDVPNFKKRGDLERKWVSQVCVPIIKAARPSAKDPALVSFEYKDPKPGRKELHIKGRFKGRVSNRDYTANMVVHIDAHDRESWEVLRIDYDDNSTNVVSYSRKNIEALIKKFNGE